MNNPNDPGHGSSTAAWTAVFIMLLGIASGTLFFWLDMPVLVIACLVIVVLGPVTGWIMARFGYGVNGTKSRFNN